MEHLKPDYIILPFNFYNLSTKDRGKIAQELPEIVTQQLIPFTWKDKWESMKPFLTE
jgi:hypothetical protein